MVNPIKVTRVSIAQPDDRALADTHRPVPEHKMVRVTRDATRPNNRAAHRAVSVGRLVAKMSKVIPKADHLATHAAAGPVTAKVVRAVKRAMDKVGREINVGTRKANPMSSRAGTRLAPRTAELLEIVVRRAATRTIRHPTTSSKTLLTMTSAEDVVASSRTTHRSRHSINAPLTFHGRLGLWETRDRNAVDLFLTKRILSKVRPAAIRLNVVRFADRAATIKRLVANFPLAAEVNVRLRRVR